MLEYFELLKVEEKAKEIKIYLEEKNNINIDEAALPGRELYTVVINIYKRYTIA